MNRLFQIGLGILACGAVGAVALQAAAERPNAAAPGVVDAAAARSHIGETLAVVGTVSEVHFAGSATFIDLDGRYPYEQFTGVIFPDRSAQFRDVGALEGKRITIRGKIRLFRGRPEIILTSRDQIQSE